MSEEHETKQGETPEKDASLKDYLDNHDEEYAVGLLLDRIARLERERDEARRIAEERRRSALIHWGLKGIPPSERFSWETGEEGGA